MQRYKIVQLIEEVLSDFNVGEPDEVADSLFERLLEEGVFDPDGPLELPSLDDVSRLDLFDDRED